MGSTVVVKCGLYSQGGLIQTQAIIVNEFAIKLPRSLGESFPMRPRPSVRKVSHQSSMNSEQLSRWILHDPPTADLLPPASEQRLTRQTPHDCRDQSVSVPISGAAIITASRSRRAVSLMLLMILALPFSLPISTFSSSPTDEREHR